MNKEQQMVLDFMNKFKQSISNTITMSGAKTQTLRVRLIQEELQEYTEALIESNIVKVADALGDLLYVVYGAANAHGIDMEPIFNEIHRANMDKEGGVMRKDGKWVKPSGWKPPDIKGLLVKQVKEKNWRI